jgi:addiction module RelB/DinJ family antitoxin
MTLIQVHFRVAEEDKKTFDDKFKAMGMNSTEGYKIFMHKVIETGTLPFDLGTPSARLQTGIKSQDYVAFNTAEKGLSYLND